MMVFIVLSIKGMEWSTLKLRDASFRTAKNSHLSTLKANRAAFIAPHIAKRVCAIISTCLASRAVAKHNHLITPQVNQERSIVPHTKNMAW
jgi:hypothetical protein